jgi:hypothetical protein
VVNSGQHFQGSGGASEKSSRIIDRQGRLSYYSQSPYPCGIPFGHLIDAF